jgi:hypothetical protein
MLCAPAFIRSAAMPLYYFHIRDGTDIIDDEGSQLAGPDQARQQAITTAGELLRDKGKGFWGGEEWTMQVVDEAGDTVCSLKFTAE